MLRILTIFASILTTFLTFRMLPRVVAMRRERRKELSGTHARLVNTLDEFNKLYHQAPCGYHSIDRDGKIVAMNATALKWLGFAPDEVINKLKFRDILTADSGKTFVQILPRLIDSGFIRELELEVVRPDGTRFPVLTNAIAIKDSAGLYSMSRWTVFDISTRKEAEKALVENQQFTRAIIDSANDAFVAINRETQITDWNKQAEKIFGWTATEVLSRTLTDTIVPARERAAYAQGLKQALSMGDSSILNERLEMMATHKDGNEFPVELAIFPVRVGEKLQFCAFIHDITERKEVEEAVETARDQALEAARFKAEFLANMSHEIRTPMNGILGMTEILMRSGLNEKQSGYANTIQEAGRSLLAIINDILDFSKIEAGKLVVETAEMEPVRIVESIAELLTHQARKKKLTLLTFVDPKIPHILHGDPGRLRQILMNFAGNAIKFSEAGQVVITAGIDSEDKNNVNVKFTVSDTGIGMTEEELSKLFQPFVQVDGSITRKYGGTGLGLSISKSLIEILGGTMGVESEKGKGSKFWFTIPMERAQHYQAPRVEQRMTKQRVLIVDDEENAREILEQYCISWGMRDAKARNAEEALELLRTAATSDPYSIALIDLFMTGTSGLQLCKMIRDDEKLKSMKLILVTAFDNPGAGEEAIQSGFDAYLTKPIKQSQLLDCMTTVVHEGKTKIASGAKPALHRTQQTGEFAKFRDELLLVVEDNETNQEVASLLLNDLGFEVHLANNGKHALDMVNNAAYALIFMDCQMPELDGFGATSAIRKSEARTGKHMTIIAMTAHALEGSREQCISAGMDDYISKPIDPEQLRLMVEKWLPDESSPREKSKDAAGAPGNGDGGAKAEPSAKPIDLEALAGKYGEKHIPRLLTAFLRDAPKHVDDLQTHYSKEDLTALMSSAHALKGICGTVFATPLRENAIAIETAGREKDWATLKKSVPKAPGLFKQLTDYLGEKSMLT